MDKMIESTKELMEEQMPSFDFLLDEEAERNSLLAEHRAWLKSIKHERPLPKHPFHVAVYIRYFNQTRYENYLSAHKKQFLDTLALCPKWDFVGFYVDEGSTAPNMETAPEWSRLCLLYTSSSDIRNHPFPSMMFFIQQDVKHIGGSGTPSVIISLAISSTIFSLR